jgi:pantoate kinase
LKESSSASYLKRTEWNVRDSDATILFSIAPTLSGGSKKTVEFTRKYNKPCVSTFMHTARRVAETEGFLDDNVTTVLNVAGPRGSKEAKLPQVRTNSFKPQNWQRNGKGQKQEVGDCVVSRCC